MLYDNYMDINIKDIIVDKNYNITLKDNGAIYTDLLDELIDKLIESKEKNEISDEEFKVLASFIIQKLMKKDIESIVKHIRPKNKKKSLFFAYSELKRNYAS